MTTEASLFYRFGVALFIGLLIGMQREYTADQYGLEESPRAMFAGLRTFTLMALVGAAAAMIADLLDAPWVFIGVIAPLGLLIAVGYYVTASHGTTGMTTEVAAIVTVLAGALAYWDQVVLAVALAVITTGLLSLKLELHGFVERLTREDIFAVLKFALITAIILPILPNETFGPPPFDVLNPYTIWLLVVLISGISFLGYVLMKLLDAREGITLTGLLGGLASSTATTLSFAERSQKTTTDLSRPFALAIMLAWVVMFGRALVEVATLNLALLQVLWPPMAVAAAAGLGYAAYLYLAAAREDDHEEVPLHNPFELSTALTFGLIFAVVLLISRAAQVTMGQSGIYLSSLIGGIAGIDPVALSLAELAQGEAGLELDVAARGIVIAALANTVAKGAIVFAAGAPALRRALLPGFVLILVAGAAAGFFLI